MKAIIQSSVFFAPLPVWAVPVLAPASRAEGKTPYAVPYFATSTMRGLITPAWATVNGVFHTVGLYRFTMTPLGPVM